MAALNAAVCRCVRLHVLSRLHAACSNGGHLPEQAIEALREIFIAALLPDRKLRFFEEQPLAAVPAGKEGVRRLLYWHLEDQLKRR